MSSGKFKEKVSRALLEEKEGGVWEVSGVSESDRDVKAVADSLLSAGFLVVYSPSVHHSGGQIEESYIQVRLGTALASGSPGEWGDVIQKMRNNRSGQRPLSVGARRFKEKVSRALLKEKERGVWKVSGVSESDRDVKAVADSLRSAGFLVAYSPSVHHGGGQTEESYIQVQLGTALASRSSGEWGDVIQRMKDGSRRQPAQSPFVLQSSLFSPSAPPPPSAPHSLYYDDSPPPYTPPAPAYAPFQPVGDDFASILTAIQDNGEVLSYFIGLDASVILNCNYLLQAEETSSPNSVIAIKYALQQLAVAKGNAVPGAILNFQSVAAQRSEALKSTHLLRALALGFAVGGLIAAVGIGCCSFPVLGVLAVAAVLGAAVGAGFYYGRPPSTPEQEMVTRLQKKS